MFLVCPSRIETSRDAKLLLSNHKCISAKWNQANILHADKQQKFIFSTVQILLSVFIAKRSINNCRKYHISIFLSFNCKDFLLLLSTVISCLCSFLSAIQILSCLRKKAVVGEYKKCIHAPRFAVWTVFSTLVLMKYQGQKMWIL